MPLRTHMTVRVHPPDGGPLRFAGHAIQRTPKRNARGHRENRCLIHPSNQTRSGRWSVLLERDLDAQLPAEPTERLDALAALQSRSGFMASIERVAGETTLVERNCPIAAVATRFPVLWSELQRDLTEIRSLPGDLRRNRKVDALLQGKAAPPSKKKAARHLRRRATRAGVLHAGGAHPLRCTLAGVSQPVTRSRPAP
jgi:hypothetical protein